MMVRRNAAGELAQFVEALWWSQTDQQRHERERALPTGSITLVINLGPDPIRIFRDEADSVGLRFLHSVVWGPQTRYVIRDLNRKGEVVGIHFRPGMAGAVLGVPASELADRFTSLEDLWGSRASALRDRLLDTDGPEQKLECIQQLLAQRRRPLLAHPAVLYALRELSGPEAPSIETVRSHTGYGAKRFIELFREATGLTPKLYSRIRRFQRVLQQASCSGGSPDWARIAAEIGYTDQAHLTHEFRSFAGITPGVYRPVPARPGHVPIKYSAATEEKTLQAIASAFRIGWDRRTCPMAGKKNNLTQGDVKIHDVFPYLRLQGAAAAIEFYCKAFGATELFRLTEPNGRIGHAEIKIGDAVVMLSDEYPEYGIQGPAKLGGTSFAMHLHCDNADALIERAVQAGATLVRPAEDHFYGERSGMIRDPFGHEWLIGHSIEQVSPEEMQRRYDELLTSFACEGHGSGN